MAGVTQVGGIDVGCAFSTGIGTVMAINTIVDKVCVVHGRWCPLIGGMAHVTFFRCLNMGGALTRGNGAVMTTGTNAQYFVVVHIRRRYGLPRCGARRVAGAAIVRGIDV